MTRPRSLLPDGPFHVVCTAVEGGVLFSRDEDRAVYLGLLHQTVRQQGWRILTFTLLSTHLHMLVWTPTPRLSAGMWWLNWKYAAWFKAGNPDHRGHVFGGRYWAKAITDEAYLLAVIRYIALNPVRAKMVASAATYPWSADRLLRSGRSDLELLAISDALEPFGGAPDAYAAFVDGKDPAAHDLVVRAVEGPPEDRPSLEELLAEPTDAALAAAHRMWGYTLQEIADHIGVHHTTVLRRIRRA